MTDDSRNPPLPVQPSVKTIENLRGPAGHLEAILNTGSPDAAYAVLVCHPHPLGGGTMHNKVVYHAMKAFQSFGLPVLRFNFRGTGLSEGEHDHGRGEQDDVRAALDWLHQTYQRPLLFAGFSFGSYVGLRACCSDTRVLARIGLGLPVLIAGRDYTYEFLAACPGPMLFVSGSDDEFCPPDILRHIVGVDESRQTILIPGADHFFQGTPESPASKLKQMQAAIRTWLESRVLPSHQAASTQPGH